MPGLIYLVQPTDCIGTNVYKIGMSNDSTIKRIKSYGPRCINIISRECENPLEVEQELIKLFQSKFGSPVQGREWFQGSKLSMINTYDECIRTHAKYVDDQLIKSSTCLADNIDTFLADKLTTYIQRHIEYTKHWTGGNMNNRCYELINILPDSWFNNNAFTMKIVHALRNEPMLVEDLIETMRKVFGHRIPNYYEGIMVRCMNTHMDSTQKRFGICALSKLIEFNHKEEYDEWSKKWKKKKTAKPKVKMVYKEGGLTKLADLKANYKGELTAEKLLKMNRSYTICKKNICKSCMNINQAGCCSLYDRKNRSTCNFVNNITLQ